MGRPLAHPPRGRAGWRMVPGGRTGKAERAALAVAVALVLGIALLVRLADPPAHRLLGVLVPADGDAAFHLHRVRRLLARPGWPGPWEPFLDFPRGAPVPWAPGWDVALALLAGLGGRLGGTGGRDLALAAAPVAAGVGAVALAMAAAARAWGARAGLAAGVALALLPQHVAATQWARFDHSAAEGLFVAWFALLLQGRGGWPLAVAMAAACWTWVGGFLYAALAGLARLAGALATGGPQLARRSGGRELLVAALLLAPAAVPHGLQVGQPLSWRHFTAFQPLLLAACGAGSLWVAALARGGAGRGPLLGAGAAVLAAALAVLGPRVAEGLGGWLQRGDPWLATVAEMQPLLKGPPWSPEAWSRALVLGGYAAPLALPAMAVALLARPLSRPRRAALAVLGAGLFALVSAQNRFGWAAAPVAALFLGGALAPVPGAPALALALYALPPAVLRTAWLAPKGELQGRPWVVEACRALAAHTPPVDPGAPAWGVLSRWVHGHWIVALGERPESLGGFGTYASGVDRWRASEAMYEGTEEALVAWMAADRLDHLLVESRDLAGVRGPLARLALGGGAGGGRPAVAHLRPWFAAPSPDPGFPAPVPGAWLYERVAGARLVGSGPPGAPVGLELTLFAPTGPIPWRAATRVGADGRFALVVPVWTDAGPPLPTAPAARLVVGEAVRAVSVPREAVLRGEPVEVPPP